MTLQLDDRQRAMLEEMGIRLAWLPRTGTPAADATASAPAPAPVARAAAQAAPPRAAPRVVVPGHGRPFDGVEQALARARSRLASFRASPSRHATHATKVLLKYKLLEWQERELDAFVAWAEGLPYLTDLWRRYFAGQPMRDWLLENAQALVASGAAALESRDGRPFIVNRG